MKPLSCCADMLRGLIVWTCLGLLRVAVAQTCSPDVLSQYHSGWPKELDFGIYWFGQGNQFEKAYAGQKTPYYDSKRPTVIYFHGWVGGDGGWVNNCKRVTTNCPVDVCIDAAETVPLFNAWLTQGWNVGIFYWDQFADEECTRDAEQKVWFDKEGDGLRWKSYDVASNTVKWVRVHSAEGSADVSFASMATDSIAEVLQDFAGPYMRFVGHSIGAQLAARCANFLHERYHPAAPQRLALLEPFFTKHHLYFFRCTKDHTDAGVAGFTAAATAALVGALQDNFNVVTEVYKSSVLTQKDAFGYPNTDLADLTTLVVYDPRWCGTPGLLDTGAGQALSTLVGAVDEMPNLQCYHTAVIPIYFLQFGTPPPMLNPLPPLNNALPGSALIACSTPSSTCSDLEIRAWIDRQKAVDGAQRWDQQTGTETFNGTDDTFMVAPALQQSPETVEANPLTLYGPTVNSNQQSNFLTSAQSTMVTSEKQLAHSELADNNVLGAVLLATAAFCCGLLGMVCFCARSANEQQLGSDVDTDADAE